MNDTSLRTLLHRWRLAVNGTSYLQPPVYTGPDVFIHHFSDHSGEAGPGIGFVARVRTGTDGHPWIGQAIAAGAPLIIAQRSPADVGVTVPDGVAYLQVADTAEAVAWLAAALYDFPAQQMTIIGVTGTNGKTTTVELIYRILRQAGLHAGMISTIRAVIGDAEEPTGLHVSTPEAPVMQRLLRRMADSGVTHCVLETTSHGLAQHRVTGVEFDISVMTNITHEHLDYHGSFAAYLAAKMRLFHLLNQPLAHYQKRIKVGKTAVYNRDDPESYPVIKAVSGPRHFTYSRKDEQANLGTRTVVTNPQGTFAELQERDLPGKLFPVNSRLLGEFNVRNMLAAAGAARALGLKWESIQAGLEDVGRLYGRMHQVDKGQPFILHVDFAHTPDGLEKAIQAARGILEQSRDGGRIITVFGSAGKRDPEKRRLMAEISSELADLTVLTAEDPRTESLDAILEAMAAGCRTRGGVEGKHFWRIPDRGQAIYFACTRAKPEDFVLICGKGHEQSMCFGTVEHPWDDVNAAEAALAAFLADEPMPDLGLPTYDPGIDWSNLTE